MLEKISETNNIVYENFVHVYLGEKNHSNSSKLVIDDQIKFAKYGSFQTTPGITKFIKAINLYVPTDYRCFEKKKKMLRALKP